MEKHRFQVVREILNTKGTFTYDYLAKNLNVSNKTIRNYIESAEEFLNEYDLYLEKQVGVGIKLIGSDKNINSAYSQCLKELDKSNNYSMLVRENVIIFYLLINTRKITVGFLERAFYLTRPSIYQDLDKTAEFFRYYDIRIKKDRKNGIYLDGGEKRFRKCLTDFSSKFEGEDISEYRNFPLIYDYLLYIYDNDNNHNRNIVGRYLDQLSEYSDIEYTKREKELIITNMLITLKRIRDNFPVTIDPRVKKKISNPKVLEFIVSRKDYFKQIYDINISTTEAIYIASKISSAVKSTEVNTSDNYKTEEFITSYIEMIKPELTSFDYIWLSEKLNVMIQRLLHKKNFELDYNNPNKKTIRKKYPELFKIAEKIVPMVNGEYDVMIPEDVLADLTIILATSKQLGYRKLKVFYNDEKQYNLYEFNKILLMNNIPYISEILNKENETYDIILSHNSDNINDNTIVIPDIIDNDYIEILKKQIYRRYLEINNDIK